MNIDFEKTPDIIFDWVEKFSFAELTASQKTQVLLYFSEEDYEGMYQTSQNLKSVLIQDLSLESDPKKDALLNYFDKNKGQKKKNKFKVVIAWQAAAVLLMLLSGWLFYRVFDLQKAEGILQVASTDTVYVTKEITSQPELIHDTVYLYKQSTNSEQQDAKLTRTVLGRESNLKDQEALPLTESEDLKTSPKGNSMKDDSLLKKFGFVAM